MNETCETCRFSHYVWRKGDDYIYTPNYGESAPAKRSHDFAHCRKAPPTVTGDYTNGIDTVWPTVSPDDWCGEHRQHSPAKDD